MSKIQSRVEYYLIAINMQKSFNRSAQFIKSLVRKTWFKSPRIFKALPIFHHTHPIFIKVTFSFRKFVSPCKKSAQYFEKLKKYLLAFLNFYQYTKNQFTPVIFSLR